ncbi:cytochrome d ubiquinol oxidase subunit II [Kineococcus rubinsiae]|uniref:cytochrome d ubiquinol oxidase subunit II n=1 Tax=Kineococcus rubinsiae TaxID=2609562 RepID=UPI0014305437|nr:cytochrome d ubiquinol oxidase subunit II [Kineococcus rubinsiae]NIZ93648.1 cytochrome d ubiquinol oxidase subunit II [Kineococcus rubinsiae]
MPFDLDLPVLWFAVAVLAWVLFFVLEGFDFGVGFLAPLLGRTDAERGAVVRTVGPVWDGNEVWLVAAVGVTFAAFPDWYAALLSGLYLPMVAILLLLAARGVAIEFRGKQDSPRWHARCDAVLATSSVLLAAGWGAVLGVLVSGLAMAADGEVHSAGVLGGLGRSLEPLGQPGAVLGAVAGPLLAAVQGATFLGLRTSGVLRVRARRVAVAGAAAAAVGTAVAVVTSTQPVVALAAGLLAVAAVAAWTRHEALAFTASSLAVAAAVAGVFTAHLPVLLPTTLPGGADVALRTAAASEHVLQLISVAGVVVLPGVVAYQVFSYWVFRRRVASPRAVPAARPAPGAAAVSR